MIAMASLLAALPVECESPNAIETGNAMELLQTAVSQQAAYSYSRERIHSTPRHNRSYSRRTASPTVSSSERHHSPPRGHDPPHDNNNVQALMDEAR